MAARCTCQPDFFSNGQLVCTKLDLADPHNETDPSDWNEIRGIWGRFAQCQIWFGNLNKTHFLKPSSQVNNFTVFFNFSLECETLVSAEVAGHGNVY